MNNIKITNPYLGFIAIPLFIAVAIGFFLLPKYKRYSVKNLISLGLHVLMIITLTLTFMDIRFLHTSNDTELVVLADCSESTKAESEEMDTLVKDIYDQGKDKGNKVSLVCFAGDAKTLVDFNGSYKAVSQIYKDSGFDTSSSNIQKALEYSKGLFGKDSVKRLVLVSDGKETDGSAIDSLEALLNDSVIVDCVYLNQNIDDEVILTGIEYTDRCFVNREQKLKASIYSYSESTAKVDLNCLGETRLTQEVNLNKGLNVVNFTLPSDKVGTFDYEVKVTPKEETDKYMENNMKSFTQDFSDELNVLLLGKENTDLQAIKDMNLYSEKTKIDSYTDENRYPYELDDFMKYDEIILSDVNVGNLAYGDKLIENLETAVKFYGKSLITYGATYSSQSSDFVKQYNDMLPVQFESDEPKALILLIDVSYSMEGNKMAQAKAGAIACLDLLGEKDYVGVITFSDDVNVVVPLMPAKNKSRIMRSVSTIDVQGGTSMLPGLKKCEEILGNAQFEFKNVITLSDGLPFEKETELRNEVIRMAAKNISCSFINIANPSGSALLTKLSVFGNGTYYFAQSASSIVKVISSSVSDEFTNQAIEETTQVQVRTEDEAVLKDVDATSLSVDGYNGCRLKNLATTVLTVQHRDENSFSSITTIPLYAYWDYGKGRVSSFTSSLSGNWTYNFRASDSGKKFFRNATNNSLPARKVTNNLDFTYETNGKNASVSLTANDSDKTADVKLTVKDPRGEEKVYSLSFDGTSYVGGIDCPINGKYDVRVSYKPSDSSKEEETGDYTLYFDYSSEFDFTKDQDNTLLYDLSKSNGSYSKGKYELKTLDSELQFMSYRSSMVYFLIASVIIFLIDVFIRKTDFKKKKPKTVKEIGTF